MQDEPDPPRKFYGFKLREFERANPKAPRGPADSKQPAPDPGIPKADGERIDVKDLIRAGAGPLGSNSVKNRDNEVHTMLRENLARDIAAGNYELGELDDSKRRKRIRNFWLLLAAFDGPLGLFAFKIGHEAALPFACAIAGIGLFTSYLTWHTFFLRTHY